ncbi:helix-turn-helix domain-containing protein [Brassicibacter mesophilus]|uniref:helix-turn-helix domain-containing protein n=1 Tax=Brassicibacter mesophilus TaxID=745119 RepID=UPI003D231C05
MLGDKIKKLRNDKGLTQKQLANKLEVAQSTIGMIERNERGAGNELLVKFADFFNVSTDYLLGKDEYDSLIEHEVAKDFIYPLIMFLKKNSSLLKKRINSFLNDYGYDYIEDEFTFEEAEKFYYDKIIRYDYNSILSEIEKLGLSYKLDEDKKIIIYIKKSNESKIDENKSVKNTLPIVPEEFTNPEEARAYVDKHQIFGSSGFDADNLSDDEILEFANELLRQMEIISYKYKK